MSMKKIVFAFIFSSVIASANAQEFGLSFSYFLPRNGYFSTPISPFSLRGVGVNLNDYFALQTGASLYRMSGLNIIDMPFESKEALLGPNFTIFIPVELVLQFRGKSAQLDLKGGAFAFHGFGQKLNYGNFDRSIRAYENWSVANAELTFDNHPGFGYQGGIEFTVDVTRQFAVSLEANYLLGTAKFPLKGSYTGAANGGTLTTRTVNYEDAKVDFTGLEISIGVIMRGGR